MSEKPSPTIERFNAWAADADQHENHWVPVSPDTLRAVAEEIKELEETLARRNETLRKIGEHLVPFGWRGSVRGELADAVRIALQGAYQCAAVFTERNKQQ